MQPAPMPGIMQLVVLFQALSGMNGGQAPIGMPPMPEKAVVSRVAPDECLLYMSMSGTTAPDAASANKTEQLLAQAEVRALFASIDAVARGAIQKNAPSADEARDAMHAYDVAKTFLTHPWCAFVSELDIASGGPPAVKGGLLLYLGDDMEQFKSHLDVLLSKAKSGEITPVTIADKEFSRAESSDGLTLTWGFQKGIFVAGLGEGTVEAMPGRIATPAPNWLMEMKGELPVARPAIVTYANLAALREQLFAAMAADAPEVAEPAEKVFATLGLDRFKSFKVISGMDETGMVEKTLIESEGPFSGPLSVILGGKLEPADLDVIPDDAVNAVVMNINVSELFRSIRETADVIQPGTSAAIEKQGAGMVGMAGFKTLDEVLATVGETWTFSSSPADPSSPYAGVLVTVEVKQDFSRILQTIEGLILMTGSKEGVKLVKVQIAGTEVSTLQVPQAPPGIEPCWCIKEGRLLVSASKKGMEGALSRASSGSRVAQVSQIAEALAGADPPAVLMYSDTKSSMEATYPQLPMLLGAASAATGEAGVDLSALKLPQMATLLPYAEPTVILVRKTSAGIAIEQRATMPGLSSSAAAPVLVAILLPAVQAAREAAAKAAGQAAAKMAEPRRQ